MSTVNSIYNYQIVLDRLAGKYFHEIAKKHNLRHGTQARAIYQNTLSRIVNGSDLLTREISKEAVRNMRDGK